MPVYKAEKYLHRCVDSILSQSFTDWECFLVDDGSPDRSGAICDEYAKKDARVKVIHKKNEGPGVARNTGIDNATGKYILFIDSDDWVGPKHIEHLYTSIESSKASIVFQGLTKTDGKNEKIPFESTNETYRFEELPRMFEEHPVEHNGYSVCKLYCADIIKDNNIRYPSDIRFGEDLIFTLKVISHSNTFCFIDALDYYYFCNVESLSHTRNPFELEYSCYSNIVDVMEYIIIRGKFSVCDFSSTYSWASRYVYRGIVSMYNKGVTFRKFRQRINYYTKIRAKKINILMKYNGSTTVEKTIYRFLYFRFNLLLDGLFVLYFKYRPKALKD